MFKHFGKAKINALVSISGCFDLQRLTDSQKEQSEFPDMKMMVTTFLGKNLEDTRAYLKTDDANNNGRSVGLLSLSGFIKIFLPS